MMLYCESCYCVHNFKVVTEKTMNKQHESRQALSLKLQLPDFTSLKDPFGRIIA